MANSEKEEVQNRASVKLRRLKLVQYCVQLTIGKNENFTKTAVTFLQDNCLDLVRFAFLRKLSGCVRNIRAFCQHPLMLIKSAVLANTNISLKPPNIGSSLIRNTSYE